MYGLNNIVTTLKNTLLHNCNCGSLGRVALNSQQNGNAFDVVLVPLSEVKTDEKHFQNRGDKYSAKSVQSIIDAVGNGNFNWFAFDPVILWENSNGEKFVLSGHSRTQAFREINEKHPDWQVDGIFFDAIPARIYKGSFENAKQLALNSNTLATPETITERAAYFRNLREKNAIKDGKELQTLRKKALKENNGQMIWDISFLPGDGISFNALKSFKLGEQDGSPENFLRLATICQWIGKAFQIYKGLSAAHDRELFNFLMNGGYGSKSGQYFNFTSLNDRLQKLYENNVADDRKVNARGEYTEPFQIAAYKKNDSEIEELTQLKKESDDAFKELKKKFKELRDNSATREQIYEIATPYFNGWANALYKYWQLLDRVPKKDNTPSLFGLGRVNPKLYFNDRLLSDRMFQLATRIAEQAESAGLTEPQEIRNLIDTQIELQSFLDWQEDDAEILEYLKKKVQNPYLATNVENVNTTPVRPSANDVRFTTRKWNRWARVQTLWGDFIEALKLLVEPRNLVSDYFKTIIVYNSAAPNTEKTFRDIASALDFAFEKGHLLKHDWYIINDKNKSVINYSDIPESLNGLFNGIFGDGLGKPTIKLEFETNSELADFLKGKKTASQYAASDITDSYTFENGFIVPKKKKSKKDNKAITAKNISELPPSDGTKQLPPSDGPKQLPPSDGPKQLPPSNGPKQLPPFDGPKQLPPSTLPEVVTAPTTAQATTPAQKSSEPDWTAIEKRFANASGWSSMDPERSARVHTQEFKELYNKYVALVDPSKIDAFNNFFNNYVNEIIAARSKTASWAVTGSGGISASKARKLNAASDKYMQLSANFGAYLLEFVNKLNRSARRAEFVAKSLDERAQDRFNELKKVVDYIVASTNLLQNFKKDRNLILQHPKYSFYLRMYGRPELAESETVRMQQYNINLDKAGLYDKIFREYKNGNNLVVNKILDYLKENKDIY